MYFLYDLQYFIICEFISGIYNTHIYYSTIAKISFCLTIIKSSPSYFTSVPEYLFRTTLSPFFTIISISFPSTFPPGPTSNTSAICGFSLLFAVNMITLFVVYSDSIILTTTLSNNGFNIKITSLSLITTLYFMLVVIIILQNY